MSLEHVEKIKEWKGLVCSTYPLIKQISREGVVIGPGWLELNGYRVSTHLDGRTAGATYNKVRPYMDSTIPQVGEILKKTLLPHPEVMASIVAGEKNSFRWGDITDISKSLDTIVDILIPSRFFTKSGDIKVGVSCEVDLNLPGDTQYLKEARGTLEVPNWLNFLSFHTEYQVLAILQKDRLNRIADELLSAINRVVEVSH